MESASIQPTMNDTNPASDAGLKPIDDTGGFCEECRGRSAFLSLDEAAGVLRTDNVRARKFITAGHIHHGRAKDGSFRVCIVSMLRKQKMLRIAHDLVIHTTADRELDEGQMLNE